jgi:hypothetical protein
MLSAMLICPQPTIPVMLDIGNKIIGPFTIFKRSKQ